MSTIWGSLHGNAKGVEVIKVHFKNAFRGRDQTLATIDRVWQVSDSDSSKVIINDSNEVVIIGGVSLKLRDGYELAIKSVDIDGNKVYVELLKNESIVNFAVIIPPQESVVDSAVIITSQKVDDIYTFEKDICCVA